MTTMLVLTFSHQDVDRELTFQLEPNDDLMNELANDIAVALDFSTDFHQVQLVEPITKVLFPRVG